MTLPLSSFEDIHTHGRIGPRMITCIEPSEEISGEYGSAWYSVGIHPWHTDRAVTDEEWKHLETKISDPRVVAVGEIGLDALRGGSTEVQEDVFVRQCRMAEKVGKPVIVHCVRRYGRLLELHRQLAPSQKWIVHGFTGKPELARQLLAEGLDISFGERFNAESAAVVPPERMHFETDMSELPIDLICHRVQTQK